MAQMVPGDQINVALRKQLLLGMFPASPAAAHSHFYYLLFFRTAAGVSLQLCGNMLKAGPRRAREGSSLPAASLGRGASLPVAPPAPCGPVLQLRCCVPVSCVGFYPRVMPRFPAHP